MRDLIVVGGGAGGLAVATEVKKAGHDVLLIEREDRLGGILNQCIHNGFGLEVFKEEFTGPEYAHEFTKIFLDEKINHLLDTTVLNIDRAEDYFSVRASNSKDGIIEYKTKAVVLATGSYERTSGQISIPGDRPFGVITAGSAQRYLNIDGYMVGKKVFILGSGDIGLIMARRMTLEGAKVLGVAELMPYSNGLNRNIVQCLNDFDIPLYLSHTVTKVESDENRRLKSITLSKVDNKFNPIKGSEKQFEVDTLLLSIGLIPDVTLLEGLGVDIDPLSKSAKIDQTYQTNIEGLFLCGNALQIHDLVDNVTMESKRAGSAIHDYLISHKHSHQTIDVKAGALVGYVTPQRLDLSASTKEVLLSFRSRSKIDKAVLKIYQGNELIVEKNKIFVLPAEMETFKLSIEQLVSNEDITVSLEVRS